MMENFENFEFEEKFNPWNIESLEDLHFYCCPQCEFRNLSKSEFIKHAVMEHPDSQDAIDKLEGKKGMKSEKRDLKKVKVSWVSDLEVPQLIDLEDMTPRNQSDDARRKDKMSKLCSSNETDFVIEKENIVNFGNYVDQSCLVKCEYCKNYAKYTPSELHAHQLRNHRSEVLNERQEYQHTLQKRRHQDDQNETDRSKKNSKLPKDAYCFLELKDDSQLAFRKLSKAKVTLTKFSQSKIDKQSKKSESSKPLKKNQRLQDVIDKLEGKQHLISITESSPDSDDNISIVEVVPKKKNDEAITPPIKLIIHLSRSACGRKALEDSEVFVQHALDNHKLSKESVEMVSHDQDEITTDHQMEDNQESEKIIKSSKRKRKQIIHTREEF